MARGPLGMILLALIAGCAAPSATPPAARGAKAPAEETPKMKPKMTPLADELAFLRRHIRPIVLEGEGGGRVVLSAEYQGRVMTSAVGEGAPSLGWINHDFIEANESGTQFDNFGGEDRLWLGPEGGQFGLYFPPGAPFELDHWQTPHAMQEGAWRVVASDARSATFARSMKVTNWSNTTFDVDVKRTIRVLGRVDAERLLGVTTDAALVAYESDNTITNAGKTPWTRDSGLLSIWILAMYTPAKDARVVVPFDPKAGGPVVNDAYFGKVPGDRLEVREAEGVLFFRCDGDKRSKIGLPPARAKGALGSYSGEARLLTIVTYDPAPPTAPYVNSMWEKQAEPYGGDVVNSYNDGPTSPGKPPLGGFYELETSSPALALAPGASGRHRHRTFHFVGDPPALSPIAERVLGVSLEEIARSLRR